MTPAKSSNRAGVGPDADRKLAIVGQRLRRDREARNVGVRELARRIGVSPSLISAIELGKANPSIGTLYEIVDELDLSLDELMQPEQEQPETVPPPPPPQQQSVTIPRSPDETGAWKPTPEDPVQRADSRASLRLPGVLWERLTVDDDPDVDFLEVTYDVGAESCPEDKLMRHAGFEYGRILEGQLGVRIRFKTYELGPGDSIAFNSMQPHRFWTIGDEPSKSIWLVVKHRHDPRLLDGSFG